MKINYHFNPESPEHIQFKECASCGCEIGDLNDLCEKCFQKSQNNIKYLKMKKIRKLIKINKDGSIDAFENLTDFVMKNPKYRKHKHLIIKRLTRLKIAFEAPEFTLIRLNFEYINNQFGIINFK